MQAAQSLAHCAGRLAVGDLQRGKLRLPHRLARAAQGPAEQVRLAGQVVLPLRTDQRTARRLHGQVDALERLPGDLAARLERQHRAQSARVEAVDRLLRRRRDGFVEAQQPVGAAVVPDRRADRHGLPGQRRLPGLQHDRAGPLLAAVARVGARLAVEDEALGRGVVAVVHQHLLHHILDPLDRRGRVARLLQKGRDLPGELVGDGLALVLLRVRAEGFLDRVGDLFHIEGDDPSVALFDD